MNALPAKPLRGPARWRREVLASFAIALSEGRSTCSVRGFRIARAWGQGSRGFVVGFGPAEPISDLLAELNGELHGKWAVERFDYSRDVYTFKRVS